ncbi:adenine phosphoribosyltransferase-like isoform X2 [Pollicipes pollicipes]|uniref:adenine phosphoribosyltransferase-like isoform X2 n=1 Tax=Pollicipes pollicipes TaxID=41117 RepID=UPI0018849B71|nr:adenine phosphoribosyltransferase-like isoform X2 [Pollicipes pollicipes]XP_037075772.1 adenine phosphoribosyltransferase-like isoform X2 [Pollicipes pollicipes]
MGPARDISKNISSNMEEDKIAILKNAIGSYPDFPKKGVLFRDVFGVLLQPAAFATLRDVLLARVRHLEPAPEAVVALDARGFLFGPLLALEFGLPFVPIRKRGKLPGAVKSVTYQLEYGQDTFEIQDGALAKGQNVLIVDDLLATGGTMAAACQLVSDVGASVVSCLVVIELRELRGRDKIAAPVHTVLQY